MSNLFDTYYYRITKLFCSVVGIWPYQAQNKRRVIQLIQMSILYSYIPPQINRLYQVWGKDIDAMCMCMPPLLSLILCTVKVVTINRYSSEIKLLLQQIETEWKVIHPGEEDKILMNYTLKSRKLCMIYSIMLCNGLLCYIIMPTFSSILDIVLPKNETRARSLAFDLDYGIDEQDYWFWLWLHSSMAGAVVIISVVAADVLYITITIHCCCLFAITRYKLEHMAHSTKGNTMLYLKNDRHNTEIYNIYHYDAEIRSKVKRQAAVVRECVISHKKAIKYSQLLYCIYTWNFLLAIGLNIIVISISAIQLVSKLFQWDAMIMAGVYVIGDLTHIFFLSLIAQYLLDHSKEVHESAYLASWYNMPVKFQKDVVFILMRSRTPSYLTAGKLLVISLENFCTILQTSMSYFTLLVSFR